ncbi:T9SS type A sorting domain-containing protein, partial [Hymenobacter sp. IS2118]|uniref:T9SS type A sorting domain-containing protein n=1 Tax=Hymenobacter sp. IS2118 TaxID=1505605 RepID=UPI0005567EE0
VAGGPAAATLGDVDGDGDLDLVTANVVSGLVGVALNTGTGTFLFSRNVAVSGSPLGVTLGDVDGDGDLDLLAPDYSNGLGTSVSVRLNDGTGVFSGSQNVSVGLAPGDVSLGDVDGDGDLDLVTANRGLIFMGSVSVRLNNGSGTFGGGQDLILNGNAARVALADLDNDGDLDVLASNPNSSTVSVLLNNSAGLFDRVPDVGVGVAALALATGDVDGDGDVDFAVGSLMSTGIGIYFNNGSGLFNSSLPLTVGSFPIELVLGDVDGDGDPDLLVAYDDNSVTGSVRVLLNDGLGAFSDGPQVRGTGRSFRTVLADVDGDSDLDLLLPSAAGNAVGIRLNGGTGPLATAPGRAAPVPVVAFPNPATGRVQLTLPPAATTAELLDALGRAVRAVPAQAGAATLDVAGLAPGLYVVRAAGQVARLVVE